MAENIDPNKTLGLFSQSTLEIFLANKLVFGKELSRFICIASRRDVRLWKGKLKDGTCSLKRIQETTK